MLIWFQVSFICGFNFRAKQKQTSYCNISPKSPTVSMIKLYAQVWLVNAYLWWFGKSAFTFSISFTYETDAPLDSLLLITLKLQPFSLFNSSPTSQWRSDSVHLLCDFTSLCRLFAEAVLLSSRAICFCHKVPPHFLDYFFRVTSEGSLWSVACVKWHLSMNLW